MIFISKSTRPDKIKADLHKQDGFENQVQKRLTKPPDIYPGLF